MSRDQHALVGNPLASGGMELAVSKRVGFVSCCKRDCSAGCAVSVVSSKGLGFRV